jgi:hypothetical protein
VTIPVYIILGLSLFLAGYAEGGGNPVIPGRLEQDPPTFVCLGVNWIVQGDANANARVELEYRKEGKDKWLRGMGLFRVETAAVPEKERPKSGESLFAGSVIGLEEDTEYDLRLKLIDPDGGDSVRTLIGRTKKTPQAYAGGRTLHVIPGAGTTGPSRFGQPGAVSVPGIGTKNDPFRGLAEADRAARPGDTVLVHAGIYQGEWEVRRDGEPGKPIVWRGAGDGETVLDGQGDAKTRPERTISASGRHDLHFENLTVRNSTWLAVFNRGKRIVLRGCHLSGCSYAIVATGQQEGRLVEDILIEDNVIEGPSTWPRTKGIEDARGVQIEGQGSTVRYNRVRGFADGIDTFSTPPCAAIDIYGNEISEMIDDGIETDYSVRNVRCFRNRLTNVFQGISAQPVLGGPVYIIRNAMYNVEQEVFKLHNGPSGVLMFHNTLVKAGIPLVLYPGAERVGNCVSRNNLFIGTTAGYAYETTGKMENCDYDYDGFGGGPWEMFLKWNEKRYLTADDVRRDAPVYRHVAVVSPAGCFASGRLPPTDARAQAFPISANDMRLATGSEARDRGAVLPGVNDGYEGKAPDLGAYESGSPLPRYGPRP